mmetsp:Transcript_32804/g.74051  ORF Transcript_32804/g.74051 Transcript_32804/m.74051 type:complete len:88 (+) Transcript_32804:64-327(+)
MTDHSDKPAYAYTEDKKNPIGFLRSEEQMAREWEVKTQTVKALQDEIKQCFRREGTNHYQNCRELTLLYRTMIKDPYFNSYKPPPSE